MVHISGLGRRTDYDAAKISTTTTMSKDTRVCVNEATQREKKQHKCDQLIRSPVKETIELDTEFVCTHARVICVTRHKEKKKFNKKSRKLGVYFPERLCQSFSLSPSPSLSRLPLEIHATGTLVVGMSLLSFSRSSFSMLFFFCCARTV